MKYTKFDIFRMRLAYLIMPEKTKPSFANNLLTAIVTLEAVNLVADTIKKGVKEHKKK